MTNDELIARAEAALDGVTDGPWVVEYKYGCTNLIMNGDNQMADETYYPWTPENLKDWEFFAASRDLVPALLTALKASEARVKELEEALVNSRRIMANRQPDKMPDGVHICDKALKDGTQ